MRVPDTVQPLPKACAAPPAYPIRDPPKFEILDRYGIRTDRKSGHLGRIGDHRSGVADATLPHERADPHEAFCKGILDSLGNAQGLFPGLEPNIGSFATQT